MAEDTQDPSISRPLAEISHGPSAFEAFLDRNTKGLVVAAILMALAGGGVIVYRGLQDAARKEAGAALGQADTADKLKAVVTKYADSPVAGSARMLLADKQWSEQDQDGSIQTLRDMIAKEPEHPAIPSAKASLASRLVQQEKGADAEPLLKELAEGTKTRYLAPWALITLGDIAKKAGKADEADDYYKRVQEGFPQSPFNNLAGVRRKLSHFKMPAEIDAPPPAAPAPGAGAGTSNIPGANVPDAPIPADPQPGGPMIDILKNGNPIPPAPVEDEPKDAPKPQETPPPVPPVAPPPAEHSEQAPPP